MTILAPFDYYSAAPKAGRFLRRISGPFEDGISKGERKRLRKLESIGFRVEPGSISVCYPIIADNRERQSRKYGLSFADWEAFLLIPDTVYCFAVMPGLLAAAMCVRVEPRTLYVSAWADAHGQEKLSPVVLLAKGIYDFCAANGITLLDIGIAGDNEGLRAFKTRIGFHETGNDTALA